MRLEKVTLINCSLFDFRAKLVQFNFADFRNKIARLTTVTVETVRTVHGKIQTKLKPNLNAGSYLRMTLKNSKYVNKN